MAQAKKPVSVTMLRDNLENVPVFPLPAPYRFRTYRPGDDETWFRIWTLADPEHRGAKADTFAADFGYDVKELEPRQFYICDAKGEAVATASAWYKDDYKGKAWGLVHWVAVAEAAQGKGLAKPLMTRVMARLKELGHARAMLVTQPYRVRAIKIYLDFGFVPDLVSQNDFAAWREVRDALGKSVLNDMDLGDG